jgi:hypothetical protein
MRSRWTCRLVISLAAMLVAARAVEAQFVYQPGGVGNPATGEVYNVEFAANLWSPTPEMTIASEALGIAGTTIDLVSDLAVESKQLPEFRLVIRPARKHKLRLQYIPIEYTSQTTLQAAIVFNGIRYDVGVPVDATLKWRAWRFAYEYDVVYRDRGFFGLVLESKYTDVQADLAAQGIGAQFARARAPIPTVGIIGRGYLMPNISLTGEFTGIALPRISDKYDGHFYDFDIYGTVNFTNAVGVQLGYRSMDLEYQIENDSGDFLLRGWYFGGVARF